MTRAAIKARNTIILSSLFFRLRVFGTKRMFGSLTILLLSMSLKFILTDSLPKHDESLLQQTFCITNVRIRVL